MFRLWSVSLFLRLTHSHTHRAASCNRSASDKHNLNGNGISTITLPLPLNFYTIWLRVFLHPSNHSDVAMTYACKWVIYLLSFLKLLLSQLSVQFFINTTPIHPVSIDPSGRQISSPASDHIIHQDVQHHSNPPTWHQRTLKMTISQEYNYIFLIFLTLDK